MAEFCLECWNKMNKADETERKYIISKEMDLCEGCGQYKQVIIMERKVYYKYKFRHLILPIYFIWRLLILPYLIVKYKNRKN